LWAVFHREYISLVSRVPNVVIIAGPNGAGKSTVAPTLLPDGMRITRFVNADTIAQGLSAFAPEKAAFAAGRIMLREVEELARQREEFAFETTLSSRTLTGSLARCKSVGYAVHLLYLWVPSPDLSLKRIQGRVQLGGHPVPEIDVRRRYKRSVSNFINVYRELVDTWEVYNNAQEIPQLVAAGDVRGERIYDHTAWTQLQQVARMETS
jgi:predicted ABC-type ATPase